MCVSHNNGIGLLIKLVGLFVNGPVGEIKHGRKLVQFFFPSVQLFFETIFSIGCLVDPTTSRQTGNHNKTHQNDKIRNAL